jgi:aldose 1-epimerase
MKKLGYMLPLGTVLAVMSACVGGDSATQLTASGLDPAKFVAVYDGDSTALYTLKNQQGMEVCITNFGGRIVSIMVPNRKGEMVDVVLGFDSIQAYFPEANATDFGASVGRYANRINQGRFVLDGDTVQLPRNDHGHCLHGGTDMGTKGWQYRVYDANQLNDSVLQLSILSPDGDNGFPGTVKATVTYTLTYDNSIDIAYTATTDKRTIINMTQHSYFNLSGNPQKPVTDEILWVNADGFTPVDDTFMTTGEIRPVDGTPMDFRQPKAIGRDIEADDEQLHNALGYDHNFVLNSQGSIAQTALRLEDGESGIMLEMWTNEPGVQIYTGNFLDCSIVGKKGIAYPKRAGVCFESQHYPDSPNKPQWPSVVLNPGETYNSHCIYKFSVLP